MGQIGMLYWLLLLNRHDYPAGKLVSVAKYPSPAYEVPIDKVLG